MNPELKAKWVEALRSGEYEQTDGKLRRDSDEFTPAGFCCLGVLCEVAGLKRNSRGYDSVNEDNTYALQGELDIATLEYFGLTKAEQDSLVDLNDESGWSFNQIANYIETKLGAGEGAEAPDGEA